MTSALALVFEGLAARLAPDRPVRLSRWLEDNLILIDGESAGKLWSAKGAPYLAEIADCLTSDDPCNVVTVRKSQQSGASILSLGWCLYVAEREPGNILYGVPTGDALKKVSTGKLQPLIDAWQKRTGREVFKPMTQRSGQGSKTDEKVFGGGRMWLGNANAVMDLSSVTVKYGIKDELSKWDDIPGYGDPETLFFGRFTAFRRLRTYKILEISTPEVDSGDIDGAAAGHCRIDRSFKRSDQRFWHCPCPQCSEYFVHTFKNLKIDSDDPDKTVYICPHCGFPIDDTLRPAMIRAGEWRPTAEGPGRHPGFHIDAFISLMMSYAAIAEDWAKAQKAGETGRKDFSNLVLGLPYAWRGDAPDHVRLMERREDDLKRGHIPARGLLLVAAADVQMRGIYVVVRAFAPNRESWVVEALYLDGATDAPDGEAFELLDKVVLQRDWPDAFGGTRRIDALGVDSGYRTHVVYSWVAARRQKHPNSGQDIVLALDGRDGWGKPPIGTPSLVDINLDGSKIKKGAKVWPLGTWPLKGSFYSDLNKKGVKSGEAAYPPGYCHFGAWLDENFFRQITAEYLAEEVYRGRPRKIWKIASTERDNHFLDCMIYAAALAEYLGLSRITDEEWRLLAEERGGSAEPLPAPEEPEPAVGPDPLPETSRPIGERKPKPAPRAPDPFARLAQLNEVLDDDPD